MFIVSYLHTFHIFILIAALSYAGKSFTLVVEVRPLGWEWGLYVVIYF